MPLPVTIGRDGVLNQASRIGTRPALAPRPALDIAPPGSGRHSPARRRQAVGPADRLSSEPLQADDAETVRADIDVDHEPQTPAGRGGSGRQLGDIGGIVDDDGEIGEPRVQGLRRRTLAGLVTVP